MDAEIQEIVEGFREAQQASQQNQIEFTNRIPAVAEDTLKRAFS